MHKKCTEDRGHFLWGHAPRPPPPPPTPKKYAAFSHNYICERLPLTFWLKAFPGLKGKLGWLRPWQVNNQKETNKQTCKHTNKQRRENLFTTCLQSNTVKPPVSGHPLDPFKAVNLQEVSTFCSVCLWLPDYNLHVVSTGCSQSNTAISRHPLDHIQGCPLRGGVHFWGVKNVVFVCGWNEDLLLLAVSG